MALVAEALRHGGRLPVGAGAAQAEDLMSSPAVTVAEDAPLGQVAGLFRQKSVNRFPVTDANGRLVGIVSRGDLIGLAPGDAP
jgi:CBS domain-containing protein